MTLWSSFEQFNIINILYRYFEKLLVGTSPPYLSFFGTKQTCLIPFVKIWTVCSKSIYCNLDWPFLMQLSISARSVRVPSWNATHGQKAQEPRWPEAEDADPDRQVCNGLHQQPVAHPNPKIWASRAGRARPAVLGIRGAGWSGRKGAQILGGAEAGWRQRQAIRQRCVMPFK